MVHLDLPWPTLPSGFWYGTVAHRLTTISVEQRVFGRCRNLRRGLASQSDCGQLLRLTPAGSRRSDAEHDENRGPQRQVSPLTARDDASSFG